MKQYSSTAISGAIGAAAQVGTEERRAFMRHLMRGGSWGYWCWLNADRGGVRTAWWPTDKPSSLPGRNFTNVYYSVCPIGDDLSKGAVRADGSVSSGRHTAADVVAVNALWADVDSQDHGGDMAAALAVLERAPLPASVIVNSGHGWHGYWLLAEPYQIAGDTARRAQIAGLLRRWTVAVGGDRAVGDLARVLRVPGSINHKAEKGLPPIPSAWHSFDLTRQYTVADIEAALPPVAQPAPSTTARALPPRQTAPDDVERARQALAQIAGWRADDRDQWVAVGQSLQELGTSGLMLWEHWSRQSAKFVEGECERLWRGFNGSGRTLGTLHYLAQIDGGARYAARQARQAVPGAWAAVQPAPSAPVVLDQIARFDDDAALPTITADDLRLLPRTLAEVISAVSAHTQTAPHMAAWAALATAAAVVAGRLTVSYAGRHQVEPVNLYLVALAEPGTRKSAVMSAITQPLRDLERAEQAAAAPRIAEAERAAAVRDRTIARLTEQISSGKMTGDAVLTAEAEHRALVQERLTEPAPVLPRRISSGDATPEKIARLLAAHRRLAVLSDEGTILDAGTRYTANGGSNTDILLSAWDGAGGTIDRVKDEIVIPRGAVITVGVMTQPRRFAEFLSDARNTERGLVQRFLVVTAQRGEVLDTRPPAMPPGLLERFGAVLAYLDQIGGMITAADGSLAADILHDEERHNNALLRRGGWYDDYGSTATEWGLKLFGGGTVRMFGVLAALFAADSREGTDAAQWSTGTLEQAARAAVMLTRLTRAHTMHAYAAARGGGVTGDAHLVLTRYIPRLDHPHGVWTRRDLARKAQRLFETDALAAALDELHERRYVLLADAAAADAYDARGRLRATARLTLHPHAFDAAAAALPAEPVGATYAPDVLHGTGRWRWRVRADAPDLAEIVDADTGEVVERALPVDGLAAFIDALEQWQATQAQGATE